MALALLVGCEGPTRTIRVPVGPTAEQLATLDAAVAAVNGTRAALLAGPGVVTDAATALDGADEAAATGQRRLTQQARSTARPAVEKVAPALDALRAQADAYRAALSDLQAAAEPLEPAQQDALRRAVTAGEQEASALAAFGDEARRLWPAYAALDEAQSTWLNRTSASWYRSAREAADAYAVARKPVLPALEQARTALQQADAARRPATDRMRSALSAADTALARLRAPAG